MMLVDSLSDECKLEKRRRLFEQTMLHDSGRFKMEMNREEVKV